MPFREIRGNFVNYALQVIRDGMNGDRKWKSKLSLLFKGAEYHGYSRWDMYQDMRIVFMRPVFTVAFKNKALFMMLSQMPDRA